MLGEQDEHLLMNPKKGHLLPFISALCIIKVAKT